MGKDTRSLTKLNILMSLVKAALLLYTLHIAEAALSAAALGLILLSRRVAVTMAALIQVGAAQAIQRFVSIYNNDPVKQSSYYSASMLIVAVTVLLFGLLSFVLGDSYGPFLLGLDNYNTTLFWGTVLLTVGFTLNFVSYASWISHFKVVHANVIEIPVVAGVLWFVLVYLDSADASQIVLDLALLTVLFAIGGVFWFQVTLGRTNRLLVKPQPGVIGQTLGFGIPRCINAWLDVGLLTVAPWMLRTDTEQAGYFIVALVVYRMMQIGLAPITQILSLKIAGSHAAEFKRRFLQAFWKLLGITVFLAGMLSIAIYPLSEEILGFVFSNVDYIEGVNFYFRSVLIVFPMAMLYYVCRDVLDLGYARPLVLYCQLAAYTTFFTAYFLGMNVFGMGLHGSVALAFQLMIGVLALATLGCAGFAFRHREQAQNLEPAGS